MRLRSSWMIAVLALAAAEATGNPSLPLADADAVLACFLSVDGALAEECATRFQAVSMEATCRAGGGMLVVRYTSLPGDPDPLSDRPVVSIKVGGPDRRVGCVPGSRYVVAGAIESVVDYRSQTDAPEACDSRDLIADVLCEEHRANPIRIVFAASATVTRR